MRCIFCGGHLIRQDDELDCTTCGERFVDNKTIAAELAERLQAIVPITALTVRS
jgi:hypothetical protein